MLLSEPFKTQYDLHFSVAGFPVRVHPFFWLAAIILGLNITGGDAPHLLMWIAAMFLSILVHELGHALAFRRCGIDSRVVLYHFGGLAVPESSSWSIGFSSKSSLSSKEQVFVSAAGPGAQLALAGLVIVVFRAAGHMMIWPRILYDFDIDIPYSLPFIPPEVIWGNATPIDNPLLNDMAFYIVLPSVFWALLNLLPVYPLDGGHIAREIMVAFDPWDGVRKSLWLSVIAGAGAAIFGLLSMGPFMAIMFGLLAFSSWQILQQMSGGGGGFGGPWGGGRPW